MDELIDFDDEYDDYGGIATPKPDYDNSASLDIHLYSTADNLDRAARDLSKEIGYSLGRAVTHMKVVLLNLYWANHLSPERWVGISLNNNRYGIPIRYNVQRIEVHPLKKVTNGLASMGYIIIKLGFLDRVRHIGRCTRIQATTKLLDLLNREYEFSIDIIGRHPDEETIVLKDDDKIPTYYEDTRETMKMRRFLNQYNEFIQKTYIDVDYMGYIHHKELIGINVEHSDKYPMHLHFDLSKKKLRRVFNRDSFRCGGRFYGGFWTEMPSKLRLRLIISCQKVIECDYSGIHIMLLYNKQGIDYASSYQDPYEIPGYPKSDKHRNLFKKLLLATINADSRELAKSALQEDINFNRADYPDEIPDLDKIIDDFSEHHEPIKDYLTTGQGLKLMYHDSQIAELVMKDMMQQSIPVLPVHDSFICPKQYSYELTTAMTKAYKAITGKNLGSNQYAVKIKEPDEWNRSNNPLFEDDGYYFDLSYTEDIDLINHIINVDGIMLHDDEPQEHIVAPHKIFISVPIEYTVKNNNATQEIQAITSK